MCDFSDKKANVASAAASLLAHYPPRRGRCTLDGILELCKWRDSEAVLDIINEEISPTETSWPVIMCPSSTTQLQSSTHHRFIASEYNRVADSYRCPVCNEYVCNNEVIDMLPKTTGVLRQVESSANSTFGEYAHKYYGKDCTASVYTWECDPENRNTVMGLALMIKNRYKTTDDTSSGDFSKQGARGVWQSAHVGVVDISTGTYHFQSSFYLDIALPLCSAETMAGPRARFNGNVASTMFCFERHATVTPLKLDDLIASIGEQVQSTENSFRSRLVEIYFGKAESVAHGIRTAPQTAVSISPQNKSEEHPGRFQPSETPLVSTIDSGRRHKTDSDLNTQRQLDQVCNLSKPKDKSELYYPLQDEDVQVDEWIKVYDDQGNPYYYNEETGETLWNKPSNETIVLGILQSLNLANPPEKYYRKMRKYFRHYGMPFNLSAFLSLINDDQILELDDGSTVTALEYLVPVYGDRRKIHVYISQTQQNSLSK
ncbi:F-actin capping protein beta subunit [Trypanosoma theileri]|uniref:F-actin capping protein beta subunit n=1 Tax=Trypanosoma theileri TaxID=67003 RepID=A0A1X0NW42_9TRYP|nr:F-actin capping protein beta subunit [Trypanosoma theileri]ORC88902.1 F-actin capping protein beta subunit [Trypanosoma theileri]